MLTRAGPEIGVASTKAFTTQLAALGMLVIALAKHHGADAERERGLVSRLIELPALIERTLELDPVIHKLAERFADKHHALFLGRGALYPIAMEGALKLKEISYIHAEAYPAGRAQARPARAGRRRHAGDHRCAEQRPAREAQVEPDGSARPRRRADRVRRPRGRVQGRAMGCTVINMPRHVSYFQAAAVYTIPLQLLAYHVAILKGTDVDQPRNLAKSVTVE